MKYFKGIEYKNDHVKDKTNMLYKKKRELKTDHITKKKNFNKQKSKQNQSIKLNSIEDKEKNN